MEIFPFGPDDPAAVAEAVAVLDAAAAVDCPQAFRDTPASYAGSLRHGWDGEAPESYLARDHRGRLVGVLEVHISTWDNTHLAWLPLTVHPEHRRLGHGTALLSFAERRAAALGRTSMGTDCWDTTAARAFATRHEIPQKSVMVTRRQYLDQIDRRRLDDLRQTAAVAATDYELLRVAGKTPDHMLDSVAEMAQAINDAPNDDLDIEDNAFPVERLQNFETAMIGRGRRFYRVIARHRDTGELAGHTVVTVEAERPELAWQQDTSVVRAHRGHRLGLLVKSEMVRWLADVEPQLKSIDTDNAESNRYMIAVNELLGYHVVGRRPQFQRSVR